jgi:hypothetical protein
LPALAGSGSARVIGAAAGAAELAALQALGAAAVTFDPAQIGIITAWLRNEATAGQVAAVADVLNPNPTTQPTLAARPAANADASLTFGPTSALRWALTSDNYHVDKWGLVFWVRTPLSATARTIYRIRNIAGGANAESLNISISSTELVVVDVYIDASNIRRGTVVGTPIPDNLPRLCTIEWDGDPNDGSPATDAEKLTITIGGVVQVVTFSNGLGSPGAMPASLVPATGNAIIGANNPGGTSLPLTGALSRNPCLVATGRMPGVTEGLFSQAARNNLLAWEPLAA